MNQSALARHLVWLFLVLMSCMACKKDTESPDLTSTPAPITFNINANLVTPNPTYEANALYQYLRENYGKQILSGTMTLDSYDEIKWLSDNALKKPAIIGLDFMHCNRNYDWYDNEQPIKDAKSYWDNNGIPVLIWHWRDPSRTTEEFYTKNSNKPSGTTFDISQINDSNSEGYKAMLADIDWVSGQLKKLQEQNVPVIWRPLHEAAGTWFWWGAKGAQPCKKLYQLMYDRMVNYHGLRNLIWVWTREPNDEPWYPGDEYVDIVGRDIYKTGDHTSQLEEFKAMNTLYGGKKMIAITECGSMPDAANLVADKAPWAWYMTWYGDFVRSSTYNSLTLWKKNFASPYVVTLDEMNSLKQ
jgi:mannan endo-1,4-beta-mannosidase